MKIAIIGSGNVGKALAKSSLKAGHEVTLSAASADHAAGAAKAPGIRNSWPWQNGWKLVGPPEE